MFETYHGPLPIHTCSYVLRLGTCHTDDQSEASSCGEEHNACDTIRLYEDTMRGWAMDFGDHLVCEPTQQELKIPERVTTYNASEMDKAALIDEREQQCRMLKAYHRSAKRPI